MAKRKSSDRKKAERRGRWAETLAAFSLMLKGYTILARRVRNNAGEIDLIAKRKNLIAFIEVKARKSHTLALDAVTPTAQRRITRAAEVWMSKRANLAACDWRYDIITVTPRHWPSHVRDAWRAEH